MPNLTPTLEGEDRTTIEDIVIVDSGSNATGTYIKFSDGTMIAQIVRSTTITVSTAHGSIFRGNSASSAFPASFVGDPYVKSTVVSGANNDLAITNSGVYLTGTTLQLYYTSGISLAPSGTLDEHILIVGKWA